MSRKQKIRNAILVLAVIGGCLWYRYGQTSEADKIYHQLQALSAAVNKGNAEKTSQMAIKHARFAGLIDKRCEVSISNHLADGHHSASELASKVFLVRSALQTVNITIHDIDLEFIDPVTVRVEYTVRLAGQTQSGKTISENRDFQSRMIKREKEWRFVSFIDYAMVTE